MDYFCIVHNEENGMNRLRLNARGSMYSDESFIFTATHTDKFNGIRSFGGNAK